MMVLGLAMWRRSICALLALSIAAPAQAALEVDLQSPGEPRLQFHPVPSLQSRRRCCAAVMQRCDDAPSASPGNMAGHID